MTPGHFDPGTHHKVWQPTVYIYKTINHVESLMKESIENSQLNSQIFSEMFHN